MMKVKREDMPVLKILKYNSEELRNGKDEQYMFSGYLNFVPQITQFIDDFKNETLTREHRTEPSDKGVTKNGLT